MPKALVSVSATHIERTAGAVLLTHPEIVEGPPHVDGRWEYCVVVWADQVARSRFAGGWRCCVPSRREPREPRGHEPGTLA